MIYPQEPLPPEPDIERERSDLLAQIEDWLETPVMILGILWLVLLILDFTSGLSPFLNAVMLLIWGVFIIDFFVRFLLAPKKLPFLRTNWLTALSLAIPALRIGRVARVARALRGTRLVSLVSSFNRGMRILRSTLQTSGFGYVILLTLIITLLGAAGIYAFEGPVSPESIGSYGEALWWTAMIIATMGSDYWPQTAEGRLLTLLMALYAFAVFGYVTATLATFFLGQQAASRQDQTAANPLTAQSDGDLRREMSALRAEIAALRQSLNPPPDPHPGPVPDRDLPR